MGVEIYVDEIRLEGLANDLDGIYNRLSTLKSNLESLHSGIKASWNDTAVAEFSEKYEEAMEKIWELLVAVDAMGAFAAEAAAGYAAADREVEALL